MNKINIALVIGQLSYGGAEKQLCEHAIRLDKSVYNPVVFCLSEKKEPFGKTLEEGGITVYYLRRYSHFDPLRLIKLAGLFKKEKIDIVHSLLFVSNAYSLLAAGMAGVKYKIATIRSKKTGNILREAFNRFVLSRSTKIIANSREARNCYGSKVGLKKGGVSVIYNGVDADLYNKIGAADKIKEKLGIHPAATVIGTICHMTADKNIPLFLRTALRIIPRHGDVEFLLIGDGPVCRRMKKMSLKLGIAGKVHFAGFRKDIVGLIDAFDIFILTSSAESFPNALLEASAAGKPIVCTDVGGCREIVLDGKTGFTVPPRDEGLFSERISELLGSPGMRAEFGKSAKMHVRQNFSMERMMEKTQNLYQELLKKSPKRAGFKQ